MDGAERDRKLDDLADLLSDYLETLEDIVRTLMPDEAAHALAEVYRRAGLQQLS